MTRCLGLFLLAVLFPLALRAEPVTVRADEWMPVNGDPAGERAGFAIDLLRAVFEPLGMQVDYRLSGWSRSLDLVRSGEIDCVVGAFKPEAPELVYPQTPLGYDITAFYVRHDDDWRYDGIASLAERQVATIADYSYGEPVDAWLAATPDQVQVMHGLKPLARNLQKLLSGRVDVLVESPLIMDWMLKSQGLGERVREAGRADMEYTPLWLACSPKRARSADLVRLFDEGVARLVASGDIIPLMGRYGLRWPPDDGAPAP